MMWKEEWYKLHIPGRKGTMKMIKFPSVLYHRIMTEINFYIESQLPFNSSIELVDNIVHRAINQNGIEIRTNIQFCRKKGMIIKTYITNAYQNIWLGHLHSGEPWKLETGFSGLKCRNDAKSLPTRHENWREGYTMNQK